jgi:hypothetical protein
MLAAIRLIEAWNVNFLNLRKIVSTDFHVASFTSEIKLPEQCLRDLFC